MPCSTRLWAAGSTKESYLGKICHSRREAAVRRGCDRRRQKRSGRHLARHHSGGGQMPDRKPALHQRCYGIAADIKRAGCRHPYGHPQYLRNRHHQHQQHRGFQRAVAPDACQLLLPWRAAGAVRLRSGRHARRLQSGSAPHRPAPESLYRLWGRGLGGIWADPRQGGSSGGQPCVF